ncbi:GyrI-like domain-containing protein [Colwellia hornerae]|uniref:AraC family transcriptional regulator n=1 Tax=Colwellia hornerae TaxID=89402 RepID=A0A5C6QSC7_9GAMM|nr:effector binding domain-containing protein [Colwellia hornerae]TWX57703.1 AraC family transcriptional regulator [Colwellia hornerae]TWX62566.1 AraC family transcriptional regulator [Colwellia hornerae]TWX71478.1 AraC family transcriptional regulator [Colwellia hornerae]
MEIRYFAGKKINGIATRTNNAAEMDPNNGKIGTLWQTFDKTVPVDYRNGERVYGVYTNYQSDQTGEFTVLAGFDGKLLPRKINLEQVVIPEGKYLVFTHQGEMPQIAIDAWTEVWHYFSSEQAEYKREYSTDFEFYPNANQIDVHIAVS